MGPNSITSSKTSNINSAAGIENGIPANLDAESLMMYCSSQLNSLDSEISRMMGAQTESLKHKQVLGELEGIMTRHSPPRSGATFKLIEDSFEEAINQLDPSDPMRGKLEEQWNVIREDMVGVWGNVEAPSSLDHPIFSDVAINHMVGQMEAQRGTMGETFDGLADGAVSVHSYSSEQWAGNTAKITNLKDDASGNSELNMIKMQSIISQRQMAIQLTTNMMSKLDQGEASIAKNI